MQGVFEKNFIFFSMKNKKNSPRKNFGTNLLLFIFVIILRDRVDDFAYLFNALARFG